MKSENQNDHDCFYYAEFILCDGVKDLWHCSVCDNEWFEPCNYDGSHYSDE
jgi:hypothetical protein